MDVQKLIDDLELPNDFEPPNGWPCFELETLLNEYLDKTERLVIAEDLMFFVWSLFARMRTAVTFETLHQAVHEGLVTVEEHLQRGSALMNAATGEEFNIALAEEQAQGVFDFEVPEPEDFL